MHMDLYLKFANNKHIGILDVLLTETMLVTTENPGPLPSRTQIRHIQAKFGTTTPACNSAPVGDHGKPRSQGSFFYNGTAIAN